MAHTEAQDKVLYFNVMADGKFHQEVPEGTEGAVFREGDTKDGKHYAKWERLFQDVSGIITKIEIYDGNYGKNLNLTIEDEGYDPIVVSFKTSDTFGEDMLKKLLNIDRSLPVKLAPYAFENSNKKMVRGVSVTQGDKKITSYFHDYNEETKETTVKHGLPKPPIAKKGKVISGDEWKVYFTQARLHMIDFIEDELGLTNSKAAEEAANKAFDGE